MLLEGDPHEILEGVLISAYTLQVTQAFIYLRGEFALGLERLQAALNDAYAYGAVGNNIFDSGFSLDVVVHPGAGAYICGEETALLESLEGKRGFPRIKPPFFPAAIGLFGEPTVVNNVETMANIPWIVNNGGAAFAALGAGRSQAFIYLRGEFALGLERLQTALNEAYAHGAVGSNIFDSGFSLDVVVHPCVGALHSGARRRRCSSRSRASAASRGSAALLPGGHRPLRRAHRGQQRRDDGQHPLDREQRRRRLRRAGVGRSTRTWLFAR